MPGPPGSAALNVPSAQYPTIQSGVDAAQDGGTVLVADGTYTGLGNRDIDFHGKSLTVTSQNGPAKTIIDCGGYKTTDGSGNHRGFYIHSDEKNAIISGFTVKNGYEVDTSGGGICIVHSSVSVFNCTVSGNTAKGGGGVSNFNEGSVNRTITLTGCTITGNTAQSGNSGLGGGGVSNGNYNNTSFNGRGMITLTNCTITGNTAQDADGGGVSNGNDNYKLNSGIGVITLSNCTIANNTAPAGGGVYNGNGGRGTITLTGCTITGNTAQSGDSGLGGGGVFNYNANYNYGGGTTTLINCTITNNTTDTKGNGSGVYNYNNNLNDYNNRSGGGTTTLINCTITDNTTGSNGYGGVYNFNYNNDSSGKGTITLTNNIIYGDRGGEISNSGEAAPIVSFSDIQGGYSGTGNINADPLFVNAATGDLHLKPGSPCLGTGTPDGAPPTDLDGNPRPIPPSMGAYEVGAVPAAITGFTLTPDQINAPGPKVTADVVITGTFSKVYVSCTLLGLVGPPPAFNLTQNGTHWTGSFPTYFLKLAGVNPVTFTATGIRNDGTKTTQTTTLGIKAAQATFNIYLSPLVGTVSPDQLVNFRVVVSNTSQTPAFLTDIKVTLPDNMDFVSSQNFVYDGSKALDANPSLLALPSVGKALGSNLAVLSFTARVKSVAPQGSTLIIKSQISSTGFQTAQADADLTVGNGTLPTAIRVDASGGLGIFNGDSSVDMTKGNTPLHGTVTPKATMQNWVPILGDTRPLTLWLEVLSINSTNGAHYSVTDDKVSQLLDQQKLVNPSANLSYDASFNSIGDSVSITTAFGPKAALCTLTDALIQILLVAKGKPVPTLDQTISFVQDPFLSTPFTKAAKEFTTAKPQTFVEFTKCAANAANDLSDIYFSPNQQATLSGLIKKHFNATVSVGELQNAVGVLKSVDSLAHFFYDLVAYNVMTKGNPMTVTFAGSSAQNN